ncbi:hypothetical protein [Phenylobacterium montanum]|uniref:PepSY domain-containing protein n=1 Tax=Phenylobacterium montanum TaxID=2823693 RepID=A0A975IXF8_9CAUL|nr:hypothetical protein [Caulobacter sp. S6]QUD89356.1 hypothetical protein KCG34_05605 [Caulobacter sp. S6]
MLLIRRIHNLAGVFFAPAILFFAFTGALQTLGLHEHRGPGPYQPPQWIKVIASVHKDQVLPKPKPEAHEHEQAPNPDADHHPAGHDDDDDSGPNPWPLKIFVLGLAIALVTNSVLGVWMAYRAPMTRRLSMILLAAGAVLPPLLLLV